MARSFAQAGQCMARVTSFLSGNPFYFKQLVTALDAGDQARITQLINIMAQVSGLPSKSITITGAPGEPRVLWLTHTGINRSGEEVVVDFSYTLEEQQAPPPPSP